jgi:hypothetical protein
VRWGHPKARQLLDAWAHGLQLTQPELDAIRAFQSRDRNYALINRLLREPSSVNVSADWLRKVARWVEAIDATMARARTPCDVVAYRGLRDFQSLVPRIDVMPSQWRDAGFMSTTLRRKVAMDEFTRPGGSTPVLLRIFVAEGTQAIWVPPLGVISEKYQMELLLARGTALNLQAYSAEESIVVVDCEVAQ